MIGADSVGSACHNAAAPTETPPHVNGCLCRECFGLAEYMQNLTGRDHGLPPAPGHARLSVVTAGPPELTDAQACTGTMTCQCGACQQERADRMAEARNRSEPRQPWDTRRAA